MPSEPHRFERGLMGDPALVERVLARRDPFPPLAGGERILIRCDAASVDRAIARALALAVEGVEARIELIKQ
jgi:hypothetical protein